MKKLEFIFFIGLLMVILLNSCKKNDELNMTNEFEIEFNNGKSITETDILFYDSSTRLIYLKAALELNQDVTAFNVFVNKENIYSGVVRSCNLSSMPPLPYYIVDCFQYGNNILEIGFYGNSNDVRNDPGILNAFENSKLLRNGISCKIDAVEINSFENHSQVTCTIAIQNNDDINYYILDPNKMGNLDFNYFTGGLTLQNMDTKLSYPLKWSVQSGTWSSITMDDLSLLEKKSKVTYIFQSSDYDKMEAGKYTARFRFCGTQHCTPDFILNQENGRIWVGQIIADIDNIIVENK